MFYREVYMLERVFESKSIRHILKLIKHDSWLILDLDYTVMEPLRVLGSDPWFENLMHHMKNVIPNKDDAISSGLAIYHDVQHHVRVKPVEPIIVKLIKTLQDCGVPVLALTSRGSVLNETTIRQLSEIDIDFSKHHEINHPADLMKENGNRALFYQGIIFCSGIDKGKCLKEYLRVCKNKPGHIMMADDKEYHLKRVIAAMDEKHIQIRANGMRYGYLDEQVKNFNKEKTNQQKEATQQLAQIMNYLSLETQEIIRRLNLITDELDNDDRCDLEFFYLEPFDSTKRKFSELSVKYHDALQPEKRAKVSNYLCVEEKVSFFSNSARKKESVSDEKKSRLIPSFK